MVVVQYKYININPINAPIENTILPSPKLDSDTMFIITELIIATTVINKILIVLENLLFYFLSHIAVIINIDIKNIKNKYLGNNSLEYIRILYIFAII